MSELRRYGHIVTFEALHKALGLDESDVVMAVEVQNYDRRLYVSVLGGDEVVGEDLPAPLKRFHQSDKTVRLLQLGEQPEGKVV